MSTELSKTNIGMAVLGLALLMLSILASANLDGATLNAPANSENISGIYTLNATTSGWALNTSFYWSNDTGATWYAITTVTNTTPQQSEFTYPWNSSGIEDGTGLHFNATATNVTEVVSDVSTGITVDNTAPVITINQPQNNTMVSYATLNVTLTESNPSVSWWELDLNGTNFTGCVGCTEFSNATSLGDGEHNITVWSNDTLGNENSALVLFRMGSTPVTVSVKDAESGSDIQGALVNLTNSYASASNTTDSSGNATIMLDTTLLWNLTVTADGYAQNSTLTEQNFTLSQERSAIISGNSTLQGYVREMGTGNPLVANVYVYDNSTDTLVYETQSNSAGYYSFAVSGDFSYYVKFNTSGYVTQTHGNYTGSAEINATLYQSGYGSFTFIVSDKWNGRSIPGANVTVMWSVNETGTTNSSGMVLIQIPSGGSFDVLAEAAGYADNSSITGLTVTEGSNTDVQVAMLGDSRMYGYVRDSENTQGIEGAFLELWDENNTEKLGWSSVYYYNDTSLSNGYYEIYYPSTLSDLSLYIHCNATGYESKEVYSGGTQSTDVNMVGTAEVEGRAVDKGNVSVGISGATVQILNATSGSTLYQKTTNSTGYFAANIRNGTNYSLRLAKTGYTTYTDATPYDTSHDYGNIEMEGTAYVFGKLVDYQNQSININGASVRFSYGDLVYTTTTNSSGYFELNVSPGYTYNVRYTKTGYQTKNIQSVVSGYKNLGTITLTGSSAINGTVTDPTRYWWEELEDAQVKLTGSGKVYETETDSGGFYSMQIPSSIISYNIVFTKDGFKQKTVSQAGNVTLTGATHVEGRVYDFYNNENLANSELDFTDQRYNWYKITTNESGYYSIDLGMETNYYIRVTASGYDDRFVKFSEDSYFPYDSGDTGAWDRTENIYLLGETSVYVKTKDGFSGDPIENSQVCLREQGGEECVYSQTTEQEGEVNFYAKDDTYDIIVNSNGYPSESLGVFSGSISETVELNAYAKIHVYDQYAEELLRNVPNVEAGLYYYNNETEFNYTLNETTVNVTVTCGFLQRDGINVTLNGTTLATSDGNSSVLFRRVPVGNHTLTLDGNLTGCGLSSQNVTIDQGGTAYSFPIGYEAYNLNKTVLAVKVENPVGTGLENATVTANSTSQNYTANETGSGLYNFTYIIGGNYTLYANHTDYHINSTSYIVTPGTMNNFTLTPVILSPYPGNLSIYVQNSTEPLDGVSVTLDNGTEFSDTTSGAWANFTDLISIYDIKVNGTSLGYEYNLTQDYFVEPNQETVLVYTLDQTQATVLVRNQDSQLVENANVTFWNGSQVAVSGAGLALSQLTNSSGMASFSRVKPGDYNITINHTDYSEFSTSVTLYFESSPIWWQTFYLNKTMLQVTVQDTEGGPLNGTYVTLENSTFAYDENGYTDENGRVTFDLGDYYGIFNLTADGDSIGYNWSSGLVTIEEGTLNKETVVLTPNILNVTVRDPEGGLAEDGVIVSIGSIVNTTSSGHATLYEVTTGQHTLLTDGTLQGYGTNSTSVTVDYGTNAFTSLVNITRLTVHVYNSSGSVEGATVSVLNLGTGQLEQNGKGQDMNGSTDSNGNVTFSYVPVGDYNITVNKSGIFNSTAYVLGVPQSGRNNTVSIDPEEPPSHPPYQGDPDDPPLLFTVFNSTGSPIENVKISAVDRTDNSTVEGYTNSSGQVVLNVLNNRLFNFIVDGEAAGYGKITNYSVPIGYALASDGSTDNSGMATIHVDGRTNYFVRTNKSYGYYEHDDNDTGTVRNGTYDDELSSNPYVRPSIQVPLTGKTNLTGTVYDANFVNPVDLDYEPVYSRVDLYYSSGCTGDIRYTTITESNGSYSMTISPKQRGFDVTMSYCMKVTGTGWETGYEYSKEFQAGAEELNESMEGAGDVNGHVREVITDKNLEKVNISLRSKKCYGGYSNCEAYRDYTDSSGAFGFNVSSHTDYYPYDILLNRTNYFSLEHNNTIYTDNTSLVYYLTPLGRSILNLNVTGSNITENVTVKWGDTVYSSSHYYCDFSGNTLSCLLPSGGRVLTVNGSHIGYGVYSEYMNLVQGQNYSLNIGLNETNVNVSIVNQDSEPLDNITVTLDGFENVTQDGHVFFNKVSGGAQNVTFSGNLSRIYGMGSQTAEINVIPGENNTYQYTFNETQFLVVVRNESSSALSGLSVYMENENKTFHNTTNSSGMVLFRQVPYGNYTLSFNGTQLGLLGYRNTTEDAEALLGEDGDSGNNKTVTLEDVKVRFNLTNETDPLENINVSLLQGSIAQNGYGSYLTNLSDSNGMVVFRNVVPDEYTDDYTYRLDGNSTGYGIYEDDVTIEESGTNVSAQISPLSLNVTVRDQDSQDLEANVTLYVSSQIGQSVKGQNLTANSTPGWASFTHLYAGSYNLTVAKENYTTYTQLHNLTFGENSLSVTLYDTSVTTTTTTTVDGGGGGGSGGATKPSTTEVSDNKVEISGLGISKDSSKILEIDEWSGLVYKIVIYASQIITNGKIIMERFSPWSVWEVPALSGDYVVYHYLKIDTENIEGRTKSVALYFSVKKDWIEENSIGTISLWKYENGWKKLEITKVSETSDRLNYKSVFPGFSYFAVAGKQGEITEEDKPGTPGPGEETVCGNGICEQGERETCPSDCEEVPGEEFNLSLLLPFLVIISGIGVWFYFRPRKAEKITRLPPPPPKPMTKVKDILSNPEAFVGKKIMIQGELKDSEFLPEENRVRYKIRDSTGEIDGLCRHAGYDGTGTIEGIVRKKKRKAYVEF